MTKNINIIQEMLCNGVVEFTYTKKNGEERKATGTKCFDTRIVGDNFIEPKGTGTEKTGVISYWDIEKEGWRSFGIESLVSVESFTHKDFYIKAAI